MIEAKPYTPPPAEFVDVFVKHGWRGIERFFGGRTSRNLRWIDESGGLDKLHRLRREYRAGVRT